MTRYGSMKTFTTIYDGSAPIITRFLWGLLLLSGIGFTVNNIADCFEKYFSYPTITKVDNNHVNLSTTGTFLTQFQALYFPIQFNVTLYANLHFNFKRFPN